MHRALLPRRTPRASAALALVRRAACTLALAAAPAAVHAQGTGGAGGADGARHAHPDSVRLVTRDIANFWRAVDLAAGRDSAERVRLLQEVYLRPGSPGLADWARVRLMAWPAVRARLVARGWSAAAADSARRQPRGTPARDSLERALPPLVEHSAAEELAAALARYPRYYAAVRARTMAIDTAAATTATVRRGLRRIAAMYPAARFPDVYFLIGTLSTGGTVSERGMLMGTEQLVGDATIPLDELPAFFRPIMAGNRADQIGGLVVHEAVHTLQREGTGRTTLLRAALAEGVADFVSELAVGPWHAATPRMRHGRANERAVWLDFRDEMDADSTIRTWMYNGLVPAPANHGATDIGYWVGYAIARAYYERARDRTAALRELLLLPDPVRVLRESGYAERFGGGGGAPPQ